MQLLNKELLFPLDSTLRWYFRRYQWIQLLSETTKGVKENFVLTRFVHCMNTRFRVGCNHQEIDAICTLLLLFICYFGLINYHNISGHVHKLTWVQQFCCSEAFRLIFFCFSIFQHYTEKYMEGNFSTSIWYAILVKIKQVN